jgi:hypothetical protein
MPDLGPAVGALFDLLSPVLGAAVRALARSVLGSLAVGLALLGLATWLTWGHGALGLALLLVPGVVALAAMTGVLAVKNAVLRGVLAAVGQLGLGKRAVLLVFSKLGVDEADAHGERAGAVARAAERVPLREAEQRLTGVVLGLLAERSGKTGVRAWVARSLLATVLSRVQAFTLARFREDGAQHGGVDLVKVRDELGSSVDGLIATQVLSQLNRLNVVVVAGYAAFVALLALAVSRLPFVTS